MTLAALAYERYIRVVHAQVVDFPWAWRAIGHIWLYSLAWTGAPLLGWNRYTLEIHQLGCSLDWASKDPNDASFILFFLLACFFVPVGIMIYSYGNILYTVRMVRWLVLWSLSASLFCMVVELEVGGAHYWMAEIVDAYHLVKTTLDVQFTTIRVTAWKSESMICLHWKGKKQDTLLR